MNGILFRACYGIKQFNLNGTERPHDTNLSETFANLDDAIAEARRCFDAECEEMKHHFYQQRKQEQAFAYVEAISGITDDEPDGDDAFDLCDAETREKLNASSFKMNGCDFD